MNVGTVVDAAGNGKKARIPGILLYSKSDFLD